MAGCAEEMRTGKRGSHCEDAMKVLIFGSGGREHALAWAAAKSKRVTEIVCAPGNGGMAAVARLAPVSLSDLDGMARSLTVPVVVSI